MKKVKCVVCKLKDTVSKTSTCPTCQKAVKYSQMDTNVLLGRIIMLLEERSK